MTCLTQTSQMRCKNSRHFFPSTFLSSNFCSSTYVLSFNPLKNWFIYMSQTETSKKYFYVFISMCLPMFLFKQSRTDPVSRTATNDRPNYYTQANQGNNARRHQHNQQVYPEEKLVKINGITTSSDITKVRKRTDTVDRIRRTE